MVVGRAEEEHKNKNRLNGSKGRPGTCRPYEKQPNRAVAMGWEKKGGTEKRSKRKRKRTSRRTEKNDGQNRERETEHCRTIRRG